jgi:hypothetical protein
MMPCPHGVVSGQCNDCLAVAFAKESEIFSEMRDRFQHGMMTKHEVDEVLVEMREKPMQEVFTYAEARAIQGHYLVAEKNYKDEYDRLLIPETHVVQVVGLDMWEEKGVGLFGCIALQYAGDANRSLPPKVVLMNKTTYEDHFVKK